LTKLIKLETTLEKNKGRLKILIKIKNMAKKEFIQELYGEETSPCIKADKILKKLDTDKYIGVYGRPDHCPIPFYLKEGKAEGEGDIVVVPNFNEYEGHLAQVCGKSGAMGINLENFKLAKTDKERERIVKAFERDKERVLHSLENCLKLLGKEVDKKDFFNNPELKGKGKVRVEIPEFAQEWFNEASVKDTYEYGRKVDCRNLEQIENFLERCRSLTGRLSKMQREQPEEYLKMVRSLEKQLDCKEE